MAKRNRSAGWQPVSVANTAHAIDRVELLLAADKLGLVSVSSPQLAHRAGLSVRCAWAWLRGQRVSSATDARFREALGFPVRAVSRAA